MFRLRPDASAFTSSESTHIVVRVAPLAWLVSDRPLAAEVRTRLCTIYGGKSNNRRVLRFYPVNIIPTFLHTRHRLFHFPEGRKDEAWKPFKKLRFLDVGELQVEAPFHVSLPTSGTIALLCLRFMYHHKMGDQWDLGSSLSLTHLKDFVKTEKKLGRDVTVSNTVLSWPHEHTNTNTYHSSIMAKQVLFLCEMYTSSE